MSPNKRRGAPCGMRRASRVIKSSARSDHPRNSPLHRRGQAASARSTRRSREWRPRPPAPTLDATDERIARALAYLQGKRSARAFQLGAVSVKGERLKISTRDREALGIAIGVALMKRGLVAPTPGNCFRLSDRGE